MAGIGFGDLEVYRLAHSLGVQLHEFSLRLPKYELYESGSQLRRASKSVAANIVEGFGRRRYKADFVKFLVVALASCDESAEWLRFIGDCHAELRTSSAQFGEQVHQLSRQLNSFLRSVEAGHRTRTGRG
jgi:four helix bundle protein